MLYVLTANDRSSISDAVLGTMFAARRSVFVDLLKWNVPVLAARYEIDQFDDVHATYLVLVAEDGMHLGSARLLPTMRPHILDSFYPELCDAAPPRGETIVEITRFCLDRRLRARERRAVRNTLVTSLAHHAIERGITAYSAIAETAWCEQILSFGWRCARLGQPKQFEGGLLAAIRIDVDAETSRLLAGSGVNADPLLLADQRQAA
jgi:N-acyl-L-homoserine lactone synthetase